MSIQRATEASPRQAEAAPSEPRPRLLTVDEYYKMAEIGILRPDETLLVLEVADTTVMFDLGEKAQMYALHGVRDYWVVDLMGHRVVIHRDPTPTRYATVWSLESGETISPLAFPDVTFTADEILG